MSINRIWHFRRCWHKGVKKDKRCLNGLIKSLQIISFGTEVVRVHPGPPIHQSLPSELFACPMTISYELSSIRTTPVNAKFNSEGGLENELAPKKPLALARKN